MATSRKTQIYLFFFITLLFTSCSHSKKIDVSNIDVNIKIERFDKDFDALRTQPAAQVTASLQNKYGAFYNDFIQQILQAGTLNDTAYFGVIRQIVNAQPYKDLEHDVDSVYPNLDKQNAELTDAFRRVKYYYPQQQIPKVYAYFSGFEAQRSIGDGYFAIGLDLFLGANSRFYPAITKAFPRYLSHFFTPDNITPSVIEGFATTDMFPEKDVDQSLLTKMIYNGKILYFMDQVLPDVPDSTKITYTPMQLDWAKKNESAIWGYLLDENLLYETDYPKIQKFINVGPFTQGIGENNESAPRLGIYIGWQIIKKYMEKNPNVTLQQLMSNTDAQQILTDSKYHPK